MPLVPPTYHQLSKASAIDRMLCETGHVAQHESGGSLIRHWRNLERPVRILVYVLIALSAVMLYQIGRAS